MPDMTTISKNVLTIAGSGLMEVLNLVQRDFNNITYQKQSWSHYEVRQIFDQFVFLKLQRAIDVLLKVGTS